MVARSSRLSSATNDEEARHLRCRFTELNQLETGTQGGVQVGRQHPVVGAYPPSHPVTAGRPPALRSVSAVRRPAGQLLRCAVPEPGKARMEQREAEPPAWLEHPGRRGHGGVEV